MLHQDQLRRSCWCGAALEEPYSDNYFICAQCGSLASRHLPSRDIKRVTDEEHDFYGKNYYLNYTREKYGFPDLEARARKELPERCLYWIRTLLKYKLPPAKAIDLGSSHGGFVAMMSWAGYDASGLELSSWLADFGRNLFGIPMLTGPVEDQNIEPGSLDVVVMMDVLEHLSDPLGTLMKCRELLSSDGILIIQTPCVPAHKTLEQLTADNDPFLSMLIDEHLYLFSEEAIRSLLTRLEMCDINFERAIFAHYDMFVVASKEPLKQSGTEAIEAALAVSPGGRMVQALIDVDDIRLSLTEHNAAIEADISALRHSLAELDEKLSLSRAELSASRAELSLSRAELEMIRQSMSWRITGPLRRLLDLLHRKRH